jgi:hypothetical protein
MQISVTDFRCFHVANDINVRPINILVGENSAGKSSFLAAVRFLLDLFRDDAKATFNKDPFYLGSYEQIAHYRGGRFGRAKEFSFSFTDVLDRTHLERRARLFGRENFVLPEEQCTNISFFNNRSQPAISELSFKSGPYGFTASLKDQVSLKIFGPQGTIDLPTKRLRGYDPLVYDLSFIEFLLRDGRFLLRGPDEHHSAQEPLLAFINELYLSGKRNLPREVFASAPVRSKPSRTYNPGESIPAADGEHIPFLLSQIKEFDKELWTEVARTLTQFGKASGLFEAVNVKRLSNTESGPFQLMVASGGSKSNIIDVGYGVSQVLPILTDLIRAPVRSMFLLQQPEVHLHPKAQAELATFFTQMVKRKHHTLFIETHSDYLIDRFRTEARDGNFKPEDISILYFRRKGHDVTIHSLTVDAKGNVQGAPSGYRQFFITEEMKSLGVKF